MKLSMSLLGLPVILMLLSELPVLGQSGFQKAHKLQMGFWIEALHADRSNKAEQQRLRVWAHKLPEQTIGLLTPAALNYLNSTPNPSPGVLKSDLSRALGVAVLWPFSKRPPTGMKVVKSVMATDSAYSVSLDGGKTFFVAYNAPGGCVVCSQAWLGKFVLRDGKYVLEWSTSSVAANQSIHLKLIENGSSSEVVLYGTNWGDAHNRLNLWAYDTRASEPKPIWSLPMQIEGAVSFKGADIIVESDTAMNHFVQPVFRKRQVFRFSDGHVKLIHTYIPKKPIWPWPYKEVIPKKRATSRQLTKT